MTWWADDSKTAASWDTIEGLRRDYPELVIWRGICGSCMARLRGTSGPVLAVGEDPMDLRVAIHLAGKHGRRVAVT